jgi:hypothetical protein
MSDLDRKRAEIAAILSDIEASQAALKASGVEFRQPEDREAYDIICRIERRLKALQRAAE